MIKKKFYKLVVVILLTLLINVKEKLRLRIIYTRLHV